MPRPLLAVLCALFALASFAHATQLFLPPPGSGVVNVREAPYHAKGDGVADDTAAIQAALDAHPNGNRIIFLPPSTYRVTDTLRWPRGRHGGESEKRTILQGVSPELSRLLVAEATPGFTDPASPRAVVFTGVKPAQRFRNAVRSLTIEIAPRNPGAIGIQFNTSNQGGLRDLDIIAAPDSGHIGIDLAYTDEIGPLYAKNVRVSGFATGILSAFSVNSMTFEHIRLENQRQVAYRNRGQVVMIRDLHTSGSAPAIQNAGPGGVFTLIDSRLAYTGAPDSAPAAIENHGFLSLTDVTTEGFSAAALHHASPSIATPPCPAPDGLVRRHESHPDLSRFPVSESARLERLPVQSAPLPDWPESPSAWANLLDHGAVGDGKADDSDALRSALRSGRPSIFLPGGYRFRISGSFKIPPYVQRIIGFEGQFFGQASFVVQSASAPPPPRPHLPSSSCASPARPAPASASTASPTTWTSPPPCSTTPASTPTPGMQGRSLRPSLEGRSTDLKDATFSAICPTDYACNYATYEEFMDEWQRAQVNPERTVLKWTAPFNVPGDHNQSVRTQDWHYIRYHDGFEELYDHRADPDELHNVTSRPENAAVKAELRARLEAHWAATAPAA